MPPLVRRSRDGNDPSDLVEVADGDSALFLEAVAGARPLPDRPRPRKPVQPPRRAPRRAARRPFVVEHDGERVEGRAHGVSVRQLSELRAGKVRPEHTLDLHRHDREAARQHLGRFVEDAAAAGVRCILVVHGRGLHSIGGPVLRDEVVATLSRGPASSLVRGFCSARPRDGGAGALYVLLDRP